MKLFLIVFFALSIVSCSDSKELNISPNEGFISFSSIIKQDWNRLCVLGPYSDNDKTASLIGFDWNIESESVISTSDHITVLVFIKDNKINHVLEIQRTVDFSVFDNQCFNRSESNFMIENGSVSFVGK